MSRQSCAISERSAESIITLSKVPDADDVVNPYIGCELACLYCYAGFMGRTVGHGITDWGKYVVAKTNAAALFEKELPKLLRQNPRPSLFLSSVTDPYQPAEKEYQLTRAILQSLIKHRYDGTIGILTKSPLILRDLDLLQQLPTAEVGLTITTTDDAVSRFLEVKAPSASSRITTLETLSRTGIKTYAFLGPLLPHYLHDLDKLDTLIKTIKDAGASYVYVEHINLRRYILERLDPVFATEAPETGIAYSPKHLKSMRHELDKEIIQLLKKHCLPLRLGQTLYHPEDAPKSV